MPANYSTVTFSQTNGLPLQKKLLPIELISLIHHVKLNEAGWWDKAIQRLILVAIWRSKKSLTVPAIVEEVHRNFKVRIADVQLQGQIQDLCSSRTLVSMPGERFRISEQRLRAFEHDLEEAKANEKQVKDIFLELLDKYCPNLPAEKTWKSFNEQLLFPLIQEMGARTYEVISGSSISVEGSARFAVFQNEFDPDLRQSLKSVILPFLDIRHSAVCSYVLRHLNAYFFLEAGSLTEETLNALSKKVRRPPVFNVFVDTNFLFSFLELHDHRSNEAANLLRFLINQVANHVGVKLCVLPITVDEARHRLRSEVELLRELPMTPNLIEAALGTQLSRLSRKFVEECKRAGRALNARDYFGQYVTNLLQILPAKDIEVFNGVLEPYLKDLQILQEVQKQYQFEMTQFGKKGKGEKQLMHDLALWHFVKDQRPAAVESPLDAKYWIVTEDFRYLGFDEFKRRHAPEEIPVCLHPTALIHMLQFWIPRTSEFEEAVLGSIRLPFISQEFDAEAEKVTVQILNNLAMFEGGSALGQESISRILLNQALRDKMSAEPDVKKQIRLVKEALVEENKKLSNQVATVLEAAQELDREVEDKKRTIERMKLELEEKDASILATQHELDEVRQYSGLLEQRLTELERFYHSHVEVEEKRRIILQFLIKHLVIPVAAIILVGLLLPAVLSLETGAFWWTAAAGWSLLLIAWVWFVDEASAEDEVIREWQPFAMFQRTRRRLFIALGFVLAAALTGAIENISWNGLVGLWERLVK